MKKLLLEYYCTAGGVRAHTHTPVVLVSFYKYPYEISRGMQPHVKGDRSRELLLCRVDLCCTGTGDINAV